MNSQVQQFTRERRSSRMLKSELVDDYGNVFACVIRNISPLGLGGTCDDLPRPGLRISLELPTAGRVTGCVTWAGDGRFGILLDHSIDPDAIRLAVIAEARSAPIFEVMPMHRPSPDYRRPALRTAI